MLTKKLLQTQLKELIAIRSLNGNQQENAKTLDLIQTMINKNATVKRIKNKSAEILLVSNTKNATDKQIMNSEFGYMVHVDVVSASTESLWNMTTEERKVITPQNKKMGKKAQTNTVALGRGVSDMKYSIPIGVSIINNLIKKNSNKTFTLAITTDEESGGFEGAHFLANNLNFKPKNLIVPDGGDNWNFVYKSKGILHIKISCEGRAAHGSRPWKGKNAISLIAKLLTKLLDKYEKNSLKPNWKTTINPGVISGGVSINQVCNKANVEIDFRYPETTSIKNILEEINKIAKNLKTKIKIEILSQGFATYTYPELPTVKKFIKIMQKNTDSTITVDQNFGASDARHFAPFNIPILMIKPIGGDIHENTEWISLDSCLEYEKGLWEFITQ